MRARLAGLDDDVPRDHLDVLVAHAAQDGEAGVVCGAERGVHAVLQDVVADVGDAGDVFEEAPMWARHIRAHLQDEVVSFSRGGRAAVAIVRWWLGELGLLAVLPLTGGPVLDVQDYVEELDQGALGVGAAAVVVPGLRAGSVVVDDAIGQTGVAHVPAAGEKRADAVVEDVRVAVLVHALEDF